MALRAIGAALLALPCVIGHAAPRSVAARHEFQRANPCPSTGERRGKCPNFVIDHVIPLCAGGPDAASNMQWQTVADAKAKDAQERKLCRRLRTT